MVFGDGGLVVAVVGVVTKEREREGLKTNRAKGV